MPSLRPTTALMPTSARHPRHLLAVAAGGLLLLASVDLQATVILVPNFSFESPALADGGSTVVAPPSWVQSGAGAYQTGVFNPQNASFAGSSGAGNLPGSAQGQQGAYLLAGGIASVNLTSAASLGIIQANTTYTLTAAFGFRTDAFALMDPTRDIGSFYIGLGANGSATPGSGYLNGSLLPIGSFSDFTMSFTTGASGPLIGQNLTVTVGYLSATNPGNPSQIMVDNIRVDDSNSTTPSGSVPDAGSTALLLAASSFALFRLKRFN